ncbi:RING-type domain-containing protein [Aphelenchoides bicaudatus]|nr:RING-type domain-containing protein [Aphelenchoides bicaudatus]
MDKNKIRSELRPLLDCYICEELIADPVRLKLCGHTFCHFCLIQHLRKSRTCAKCNREIKSDGYKVYTTDLRLQQLAYRCFPEESVYSMRKKFDLAASKKPIAYQLCAANLIYLLQHHLCAPTDKVRLRICLNKKRIVNSSINKDRRTDNKEEMILRCEHDIPLGSIKKLFAQRFKLQTSLINLFSTDTLSLNDEDTVSDLVLNSGGCFDIQVPIKIHACLRDETKPEVEKPLPPVDDDMPILEAEDYADAPSPLLPVLEPELPSTSAQEFESAVEPEEPQNQIQPVPESPIHNPSIPSTPTFEQKPMVKRKSAFEEVRPPIKLSKTNSRPELSSLQNQSPTTPTDFMNLFNMMSSAAVQQHQKPPPINIPQMPSPSIQPTTTTSASSIFASTPKLTNNHSETSIFNKAPPSAFPFMTPEMAMAAFQFQMFANNPAVIKQPQHQMPSMFPGFSPTQHLSQQPSNSSAQLAILQKAMTDAQNFNDFWIRQMNSQMQPKPNIKKPGATVKPIRREPYKATPTTPTEQRPDKSSNGSLLDGYKEGGNGAANDSNDHFQNFLTCAKI